MGETRMKKTFLTMTRRKWIILIASVCAVALIAEAVLVIHMLSKKKESTKQTTTKQNQMNNTGLGHFRSVEAPEGYHVVWRVTKSYEYLNDENPSYTVYEYDEFGRETKETEYNESGDEVISTLYFEYNQNGSRMIIWVPDKDGKPYDLRIEDLTGETTYGGVDYTLETETDDEGYYKEIRVYRESWENPGEKQLYKKVTLKYEDGRRTIARKCFTMNSESGTMKRDSIKYYELDEKGRVVKVVNPDYWGFEETIVYQRDENGTVRTKTEILRKDAETIAYDECGNLVSAKTTEEDGRSYLYMFYHPEANLPPLFDYPEMTVYEEASVNGARETDGRVETGQYDQPVIKYDETGAPSLEYEYDENGTWKGILYYDRGEKRKVMDITLDEYGNVIKSEVAKEFAKSYYSGTYEWAYFIVPNGK